MTALLDLDIPAQSADRPVGRRWFLGSLLGAAGAVALARLPTGYTAVAPVLSPGVWGSFAGPVPGSEVYLLVAVDVAGSALAHACDGASVAVWFRGRADDGILNLAGTGHRLAARTHRDRIDVSLTLDGTAHSFALGPTPADGGLFAARTVTAGATYAASWVVLDGGRQRGVLTIDAAHEGGSTGGAHTRGAAGGAHTRGTGPAPALVPARVTTAGGVRLDPVRLDRFTRKWGRLPTEATVAVPGSPQDPHNVTKVVASRPL